MRIALDLQGAQSESRFRGIGRYCLSFAHAVVRNRRPDDEILLVLNAALPESIESIRAAFHGLLPQSDIRLWHAPGPFAERSVDNGTRRATAEIVREAFLASLKPDVIHIGSLFEGYLDNSVTSINRFDTTTPVSVALYDLIPLLNPERYLDPDFLYKQCYLRKLDFLKQAALYLAISAYSRDEGRAHLGGDPKRFVNVSTATDAHFAPLQIDPAEEAALRNKFGIQGAFVMHAGAVDERKNIERLIRAFAALPPPLRNAHRLVLAGGMPEGRLDDFKKVARDAGLSAARICFTGWITDDELVRLYNLCKLFVFPSWHEGFGLPALEAMACGTPTIGAKGTSLDEVIGRESALFDPHDTHAIAAKIEQLLCDDTLRASLKSHALEQARQFSWDSTAKRALEAWSELIARRQDRQVGQAGERRPTALRKAGPRAGRKVLPDDRQALPEQAPSAAVAALPAIMQAIAAQSSAKPGVQELVELARALALNFPPPQAAKRLLVDVSIIHREDSRTGIQRVVRALLLEWLRSPPAGFQVEPFYLVQTGGRWAFCAARRFTCSLLGRPADGLADDILEPVNGDIVIALDLSPQELVAAEQAGLLRDVRRRGVEVHAVIYDLLPVLQPEVFPQESEAGHANWLRAISHFDGVLCISKAVADEFEAWTVREHRAIDGPIGRPRHIAWFHLGSDVENSVPSKGLPADHEATLSAMRARPTFLMVGTIEPRKGYLQTLQAFERCWSNGEKINLVIVGKEGWKTLPDGMRRDIPETVRWLRAHPENGSRLFWLEGISDEYLEKIYQASDCLIAASYGEGFGLPLIEAARHGLPIIARDIPVFREVAGDHARYFRGATAEDIADTISQWLVSQACGDVPMSNNIRWMTWSQSADSFLQKIDAFEKPSEKTQA